jgi:hypothetical protein
VKLLDEVKAMEKRDQYKLTLEFLRLVATILAPIMLIVLQVITKKLGLI